MSSNADIVLGSRLHEGSEMPRIRKFGNILFATLSNFLTGESLKDCASRMRIVKKSCLSEIYPLPDGLHFTPVMSAITLFNKHLIIKEIPMPYAEREGESKLHVFKDGVRFLKVILEGAIQYNPRKLFNILGIIFLIIAIAFGIRPNIEILTSELINMKKFVYRIIGINSLVIVGIYLIRIGFCITEFY